MDIVKSTKEIGNEIKKDVEVVTNKLAESFDNVAAHLPFANFAKKENSDFHLEVDLPGVKKEDINIKVEDGILTVSAVRKYKDEVKRDDYYVSESVFGRFERRFLLPDTVDSDKIDAEYKDGQLILTLHKTKKAQPKSIAIK
ncbi:Heat shock protein Hsp20 [hydrothermal vent metagenome]|uniref:Heat shock protein Hsp20 n=1 Tax=hydrothermal vent metagenome TaxID=652676 RepID=A0A1W1D242_9ZZZZ